MKLKLSPEATDEIVGQILYKSYATICEDLQKMYYEGFSQPKGYDDLLRYKKAIDVALEWYVLGWEAEK